MYRSNTCIETRHVYTIGIAASSTSWRVLGVTGFLLHWGRRCIISCIILHQLTTASVFPSATDEDYQTDNVDSKEDDKEDVNDPGGSLHIEKGGADGEGTRLKEERPPHHRIVRIITGMRGACILTSALFAFAYQQISELLPHVKVPLGNATLGQLH